MSHMRCEPPGRSWRSTTTTSRLTRLTPSGSPRLAPAAGSFSPKIAGFAVTHSSFRRYSPPTSPRSCSRLPNSLGRIWEAPRHHPSEAHHDRQNPCSSFHRDDQPTRAGRDHSGRRPPQWDSEDVALRSIAACSMTMLFVRGTAPGSGGPSIRPRLRRLNFGNVFAEAIG